MSRNLQALRAIAPKLVRPFGDAEIELRGVGLLKIVERIVSYPVVIDVIMQQGVSDFGPLLKEAPAFVMELIVDAMLSDEEVEIDTDEVREPYRKLIKALPPSQIIELAEAVRDATLPDGWDALQKKVRALLGSKIKVDIGAASGANA